LPTAALLFFALIALYIAASGKAQKVLEALGATSSQPAEPNPNATSEVPSGSNQDYMTQITNPGATNDNQDNPLYQTNYGVDLNSILGYFGTKNPNNGYLGPPTPDDMKIGSGRMTPNDNGLTQGDYTGWGMGPVQNMILSAGGLANPYSIAPKGGDSTYGYMGPPQQADIFALGRRSA
jgi:hypothetical protein